MAVTYKTAGRQRLLDFLQVHPDRQFTVDELVMEMDRTSAYTSSKSSLYRHLSELCGKGERIFARLPLIFRENDIRLSYRVLRSVQVDEIRCARTDIGKTQSLAAHAHGASEYHGIGPHFGSLSTRCG